MNSIGFYRLKDVLSIFPVSKYVWYKGMRDGLYPKPIKLGQRAVGWKKADIHDLVEKHSNGGVQYARSY